MNLCGMKVIDLIELLKSEDPERNVWVSDGFVVHDVEIKHFKDENSLIPSLVDKAGDVVIYYPNNFR